ncbi:MAG: sigma-70 family RNA polymerase sigma factor [Rhizobacter sp.]|nr:sigma-70 family RNA polymerase sigma factor [Chlorobiales bacterium]
MKSDSELIAEFKQGDARVVERAFTELVRRYQEKVYWVCRRMLNSHDDADDVSQNVFIKVHGALSNFNEEAAFFTWLYRIATNESINFIRSRKVRSAVGLDDLTVEPAADTSDPEEDMENDEQTKAIEDAIATLPEKQRAVFLMRYYDEMPYEQIAEIMGTSVGGLKANYFHAFKKIEIYLRKRLPLGG